LRCNLYTTIRRHSGVGLGDYRKLRSWQEAHQLALAVYRATADYPAEERYGLARQIRRAATSTACNLAEGAGRNRAKETAQFVRIALGSCTELEYQVLLSQELGYRRKSCLQAPHPNT
jgi:four helix bundle protein